MTMIRKQGDWMAAKVGEEIVMMSVQKGNYIGLSPVGARVWELLDTPQSLDTLCAQLQTEFDVAPDVCRAEVEPFIDQLVKHGAAKRDPA
jgi:hypothetical protein